MPHLDRWRSLKEYAVEDSKFEVGDLVLRKDQTKSESITLPKVGIVLSVDMTQQTWIKMAKVMWNGTSDIEEVATIYLSHISQDDVSD